MCALLLFALAAAVHAQPVPAAGDLSSDSRGAAPVLEVADVMPAPVGGLAAIASRVVYPELAEREQVEGTVIVQFVVEPDGTVSRVAALRSPDDRLSEAALAAVRASPFQPGEVGGEPARVQLTLPLTFRLAEPEPAPAPEAVEIADVPPTLIGGLKDLQGRVHYPENARRRGIQGTVLVTFVVDTEGRVITPEVSRSDHPALNRAALNAVIPSRFTPGLVNGQPVLVRYTVPIQFRLRESQRQADPFGRRPTRRRGGL